MIETHEAESPDAQRPGADELDLVLEMVENFEINFLSEEHNREMARADLDILSGKTWSEQEKTQRKADRRPCMSFPLLNQYTDQVIGDWRQNRADIVVRPGAGQLEPRKFVTTTGKEVEAADVMAGMIRSIVDSGKAEIARDTALEHAVSCGFGHYRIVPEYGPNGFEQEIHYKRLTDQFSVYWDAGSEEYDRRDAMHCIIAATIPKAKFKRLYPDKQYGIDIDVPDGNSTSQNRWFSGDEMQIAEYFYKKPVDVKLVLLSDGRVIRDDEKDFDTVRDELADQGVEVEAERVMTDHEVWWSKCSGAEVLEGPTKWPGRYIPVISVYGKEHPEGGGRVTYRGLIRYAHDAARMFDYMRSAGIERAALEPKVPWVVGKSQIGPYANLWKTANTRNHAFLPFDDTTNANPPQRNFPAQPSQGYFAEAAQARDDIKASIGMYDASIGQRSNETSGKAILARQREADVMSFPFIDNMGRSIQYEYEVIADLIPKIYDTRRAARMLNADETDAEVILYDEILDEETGKTVMLNDISTIRFDISVKVGPSYTTRREEASTAMMDFIGHVPEAGALIGDLIALNQDWAGADQVSKRLKHMLPPEIRAEEDEEANGEQPVPMHIQQQMEQAQMMIEELQAALQEAAPKAEKADLAIAQAKADAAAAKSQQEFDKQRQELNEQRMELKYDQRVMSLEKRFDDMRKGNEAARGTESAEAAKGHQELLARSEQAMSGFQTVSQQIAQMMAEQQKSMQQVAEQVGRASDSMANSAELMARYFTAERSMSVGADGKPRKLTVAGFGDVVINEEPATAQ